jgi:hypothetical protein
MHGHVNSATSQARVFYFRTALAPCGSKRPSPCGSKRPWLARLVNSVDHRLPIKGLIPRALFLGEMRIISPVSFELRLLE